MQTNESVITTLVDTVDRQPITGALCLSIIKQLAVKYAYEKLISILAITSGVLFGPFLMKCLDAKNYGFLHSSLLNIAIPISNNKQIDTINKFICTILKCQDIFPYHLETNHMASLKSTTFIVSNYVLMYVLFVDENDFSPTQKIVDHIRTNIDLSIFATCLSCSHLYLSSGGLSDLRNQTITINTTFLSSSFIDLEYMTKQILQYQTRNFVIKNQHEFWILVDKLGECLICLESFNLKNLDSRGIIRLDCQHYFHPQCLTRWTRYSPGDFVSLLKHKCPTCRTGTIPQRLITYPMISTVSLDLQHNRYRICTCHAIFPVSASCTIDEDTISTKCPFCSNYDEIFSCPKCGLQFQRTKGCETFRCCQHGDEHCRGMTCDHGSNEFIKFCGHRWSLLSQRNNSKQIDYSDIKTD